MHSLGLGVLDRRETEIESVYVDVMGVGGGVEHTSIMFILIMSVSCSVQPIGAVTHTTTNSAQRHHPITPRRSAQAEGLGSLGGPRHLVEW